MRILVAGQACMHEAPDLSSRGTRGLAALIGGQDAALVNLEATVETPGAWPTKVKTLHLARAGALAALRSLGFRALGLANNHAFDLGPPGISATREAAAACGLATAGAGADLAEAARPAFLDTPGGRLAVVSVDLGPQPQIVYADETRAGINPLRLRLRLGLPEAERATLARIMEATGQSAREAARIATGYRAPMPAGESEFFGLSVAPDEGISLRLVPDQADLDRLQGTIAEARSRSDRVAVLTHGHHWDADWSGTPGWFSGLARGLVEAGADLVAGTGAPIAQPIGFHRGRPIMSSLGNLIFHTRRAERYDRLGLPVFEGALVICNFPPDGGPCRLQVAACAVGRPARDGRPAPGPVRLPPQAEAAMIDRLTRHLSEDEKALVSQAPASMEA